MKEMLKFFGFGLPEPGGPGTICDGKRRLSSQATFTGNTTEDDEDQRIREKENEAFLWGMYPLY